MAAPWHGSKEARMEAARKFSRIRRTPAYADRPGDQRASIFTRRSTSLDGPTPSHPTAVAHRPVFDTVVEFVEGKFRIALWGHIRDLAGRVGLSASPYYQHVLLGDPGGYECRLVSYFSPPHSRATSLYW